MSRLLHPWGSPEGRLAAVPSGRNTPWGEQSRGVCVCVCVALEWCYRWICVWLCMLTAAILRQGHHRTPCFSLFWVSLYSVSCVSLHHSFFHVLFLVFMCHFLIPVPFPFCLPGSMSFSASSSVSLHHSFGKKTLPVGSCNYTLSFISSQFLCRAELSLDKL